MSDEHLAGVWRLVGVRECRLRLAWSRGALFSRRSTFWCLPVPKCESELPIQQRTTSA